jgi:hypothetical protein
VQRLPLTPSPVEPRCAVSADDGAAEAEGRPTLGGGDGNDEELSNKRISRTQ